MSSHFYNQALITACERGHHDLIRPLVAAGADVNATRFRGQGTLWGAIKGHHVACIKTLTTLGVDVNKSGYKGWTAVMGVVQEFGDNTEVLQLLIESGADVNTAMDTGFGASETPLECACIKGYAAAVTKLLEAGASVNTNVEGGRGPLILASECGHVAIVDLLIECAKDRSIKLLGGDIALIKASSSGHANVVKTIAELGADVNSMASTKTALVGSSENGYVDIVQFLVKAGVGVNVRARCGDTPLGIAARSGRFRCVDVLLNAGADLNHVDRYGWSIIISAASEGHVCCIDYFANVQKAGIFTRRILCKPLRNHVDRVWFFKEKPDWIKKHVEDNKRLTVFDCPEKTETKHESSECYTNCVKLLQKNGADVNKATSNGWTPLMVACLVGNKDTVEFILKSGANVNPTQTAWTPLLTAVVSDTCDCARSLIKAGANVNVEMLSYCHRRRGKKNALGFAVDIGNIEMVKLLLLSGVHLLRLRMAKPDKTEITQLLIAAGYSHPDTDNIFCRAQRDEQLLEVTPGLDLSDQCRVVIRRQLFKARPLVNRVYKVRQIGLPLPLQKYLLFGVSLD